MDVLQEESTGVGLKILALDSIMQTPDPGHFLDVRTGKEPFGITLLDLSRHTDKELAYKAGRLMELMHFDTAIEAGLSSKDEQTRRNAEAALFHMDKSRAEKILDAARWSPGKRRQQFLNDVLAGTNTRLPIPTGSSQGDRYYIQAQGDTPAALQCVNKLFSNDDFSFTPKQSPIQSNPDQSWKPIVTHFYDSKSKALAAYDDIQRCGAKPTFITPIMPARGSKH